MKPKMSQMTCEVCDKQKATITTKKSSLLQGNNIFICADCKEKKLEPRHYIIIAGRTRGFAYVRDFIIQRRYLGEEITAAELTT